MQVTEADIARIPRRNVRVPVDEFARMWRAAEQNDEHSWYRAGVAMTCRWMATATVRPDSGRWYPAFAPVTHKSGRAYEELIEAEYVAAEKLDMNRPWWLSNRPGWIEAVCATLRWAWCRSGPPPLSLPERETH